MMTARTIAACALAACLALVIALPPIDAAAMSRPKARDAKSAEAEGQAQAEGRETFMWLNSINGWNSIDDQHIVLHGGPKQVALVTTFAPCYGLSYAETIAVKAPLRYLEGNAFGTIFFNDSGYGARRCPIATIESVKDVKEAKSLVASRKQQKATEGDKTPSAY